MRLAKIFPLWVYLSLIANGFLLSIIVLLLLREQEAPKAAPANAAGLTSMAVPTPSLPKLGPSNRLSYEQWVTFLRQEAARVVQKPPSNLRILVGDSLSLWFPADLLLPEETWLNQSISGEGATGLLKRLSHLDQTRPEAIFVMIGINDLLRGASDETLLQHQRQIVQYLKRQHPDSHIVLQSILPHAGDRTTWEGRERLKPVPNSRIRTLNRQLESMASEEKVYYLDLHPLFTDQQGDMRPELTTDGLHLSHQGYWVWRSALVLFSQIKINLLIGVS
ncbi:MAG: GDSL-type esterase/lipase family protein [Leptolyngbyaceae bacterium]|nr:GDSL-type esterase/lipase family protein [Leptolyngbyaceae bacterium]